jgi:hypothetical protein
MEEICAGFSEELSQAKLAMQSKAFQIQRMQLEVTPNSFRVL